MHYFLEDDLPDDDLLFADLLSEDLPLDDLPFADLLSEFSELPAPPFSGALALPPLGFSVSSPDEIASPSLAPLVESSEESVPIESEVSVGIVCYVGKVTALLSSVIEVNMPDTAPPNSSSPLDMSEPTPLRPLESPPVGVVGVVPSMLPPGLSLS